MLSIFFITPYIIKGAVVGREVHIDLNELFFLVLGFLGSYILRHEVL